MKSLDNDMKEFHIFFNMIEYLISIYVRKYGGSLPIINFPNYLRANYDTLTMDAILDLRGNIFNDYINYVVICIDRDIDACIEIDKLYQSFKK